MSAISLADVARNVRDLPSPTLVLEQLLRSFDQVDVSIDELDGLIARDQALAARTLRLANSSFYGLQSAVRTIPQAITVLGFDSVRSLVVSAGVIDCFTPAAGSSFDYRAFWRHAIGTALAARALARCCGKSPEFAFVAGLLHDVGVLVLMTRFGTEYAAALAHQLETDCPLPEAERAVLELDHTTVGRVLAQQWKFPGMLQRAIANHHQPMDGDLGDLPAIVHVASCLVHGLDLAGVEREMAVIPLRKPWDSLRLDAAALRRVLDDTVSEFDEACQILAA